MTPSRARPASLVRNTVAQAIPRLVGYLFSFISAPIIVSGLGLRAFGVWALTGALAQYGALLNLGVGTSLARYIAANEDDRKLCGEYFAAGWLSVLVVGVVLAGVATVIAGPVARDLGGISSSQMQVVMYASAALICCSMLSTVITAYPIGRRRMVAPNIGYTVGAFINFAASVVAIELGAGLPGYALANVGAAICGVLVTAVLVLRAEGPPPLALPRPRNIRPFLAFSLKAQLVRVMDLVNYQSDKIVIAFSIGPTVAGAYELANRVAIAVREVGIYATSAVDVELTATLSRAGLNTVVDRYRRLVAVAATMGFPPVLFAVATAPLLLSAWLSHAPPDTVAVLVSLSAAYLLAVSTGVSYSVAVAAGEPGVVARTSVGAAVANIILTASLAQVLGLWGVLAGTVIALTGGSVAQVILVHRRFSLPLEAYIRAVVPALRRYVLLAIPVAIFCYADPLDSRGARVAALLVLAAAYMGACAVWALRAGRVPSAVVRAVPKPLLSRLAPQAAAR